jgi:hypothetical protein
MATTTTTLTPATLIAAGTTVAVGTPQRAARDMRGKHGGLLTAKITNAGTGPTVQAIVTVYISHTSGTTPATGGEGADWKTYAVLGGGGSTGNAVSPFSCVLPPCCHVQVEIGGNTVQNVTGEAFITDYTDLQTA